MISDKGHTELVADLFALYAEALEGEFHDFENRKYPAPKVELVNKLNDLATKVKEGKYDN